MAPLTFHRRERRKRSTTNPLAVTEELEPSDLLGASPCPLLRVPVASVTNDDGSVLASPPGATDDLHKLVTGPVTAYTAGRSRTPACADPIVHHLDSKPLGRAGYGKPTSAGLEPPLSLLDRFRADRRDSFLHVWHRLPTHLREISFDFHGPGWDPDDMIQLGDTLVEFADVVLTSPTDFSSCCPQSLEHSVPPDST